MQPHDNDKRPSEGDTDGGRHVERDTVLDAIRLAHAKIFNVAHRQVRVAEAGKPLNLSANIDGAGGVSA